MRQSKITKAMALILSLTMITSVFVGNTLSRYVTSVSSTDSARVAVWGINGEETQMNLFDTKYLVDDKVVAEANNKTDKIIAPGTKGEAEFNIINFEQDVAPEVAYEVSINLDDSEINDLIKNNPSIQWKLDDGSFGTWDELKTAVLSLSGNETGKHVYAPGQFATAFQGTQTHTISWQWLMDSNESVTTQVCDDEDNCENVTMSSQEYNTYLGNLALDGPISAVVKVSITATQTDDLVTNENMLEGMNQVINIDNLQPVVFRSKSDINNFEKVDVNGNTINKGTDYEVTEGSTIITLTESFLKTLEIGSHTIDIVSSDMIASTRFLVKDNSDLHVGVIPEGGIYYKGIDGIYSDSIGEIIFETGNYNGATIYEAGDDFPELETGDVYVFEDYEYRYNMGGDTIWWENSSLNGWRVVALDKNKSSYSNLLTNINGKNLVNLDFAFESSKIVEAPIIPETVTSMGYAFAFCEFLINAPKIPSSVVNITSTFDNCINLTGTIEINANPGFYDAALYATQISWISGLTNLREEIAEASDIVLINPNLFHNNIIPEGGTYYQNSTSVGLQDYTGATVYNAGQNFPTEINTGDIYVYGDYEYRFNMNYGYGFWQEDTSLNGWGVGALSSTKSEYEDILLSINNKDIKSMSYTFALCEIATEFPEIPATVVNLAWTYTGSGIINMPEIPYGVENMNGTFCHAMNLVGISDIPETVTNMWSTFEACESLVTAPEIPISVTNFMSTFSGCINLIGDLVIHSNPTSYDSALYGTQIESVIGLTTLFNQILATKN